MATVDEMTAMRQAIALSALGLGTTSPNPPVGCVILDATGHAVGAGFHQRKGDWHAEAFALAAAGHAARGGTAVVTLEPCNHVGVTPACRQQLLDAGVTRVVVAVLDPTSRGAGGASILAEAGIQVEVGVLADEALVVLQPWLTATTRRRPYLTWAVEVGVEAWTEPGGLTAALRQQADLVVFADRVEEGIPGGHSAERLRIPTALPTESEAEAFLGEVFAGGARSVVLAGDTTLSRAMFTLNFIDRVAVSAPRTAPAHALASIIDGALLRSFAISALTTVGGNVILEAGRRDPICAG